MTTPSHTELAARLRARAEIHKTLPFPSANDKITAIELEECAAALESPERVQGEVVAYTVAGQVRNWSRDFSMYKTQHYVRPVYAAPPTAPAQDAQGDGDFAAWLKTRASDSYSCGLLVKDALARLSATPSPQAEKQPLSLSELAVHQAVQMIADWPITDKKNMDAMNMQGIAVAALKVGIVTKEST